MKSLADNVYDQTYACLWPAAIFKYAIIVKLMVTL
jgi:hypothetical protein